MEEITLTVIASFMAPVHVPTLKKNHPLGTYSLNLQIVPSLYQESLP